MHLSLTLLKLHGKQQGQLAQRQAEGRKGELCLGNSATWRNVTGERPHGNRACVLNSKLIARWSLALWSMFTLHTPTLLVLGTWRHPGKEIVVGRSFLWTNPRHMITFWTCYFFILSLSKNSLTALSPETKTYSFFFNPKTHVHHGCLSSDCVEVCIVQKNARLKNEHTQFQNKLSQFSKCRGRKSDRNRNVLSIFTPFVGHPTLQGFCFVSHFCSTPSSTNLLKTETGFFQERHETLFFANSFIECRWHGKIEPV